MNEKYFQAVKEGKFPLVQDYVINQGVDVNYIGDDVRLFSLSSVLILVFVLSRNS